MEQVLFLFQIKENKMLETYEDFIIKNNIYKHSYYEKSNFINTITEIINKNDCKFIIVLNESSWIQSLKGLKDLVKMLDESEKNGCFSRDPYMIKNTYVNTTSCIIKNNGFTKEMFEKIKSKTIENPHYLTNWPFLQYYISDFVFQNKDKFFIFIPQILNTPVGKIIRNNWWKNENMKIDLISLTNTKICDEVNYNFINYIDTKPFPNLIDESETFEDDNARICFITAIYGNYEATCKPTCQQTVKTDFICFTNNENIESNGWEIDTTPYHFNNKSSIDNDSYVNSIKKNQHTFNIAKYYKQSFHNIKRLEKYDVIVWIDGTIKITCSNTSKYILNNICKKKIIGWHHEKRNGNLKSEVQASNFYRYTSTFWFNQAQPYQDIFKQYENYVSDGYQENLKLETENTSNSPHFGVWITCFVAFLQKDKKVKEFLDLWYLQTLKYTTQDQLGFPYAVQKLQMYPYTLPNNEIKGEPHRFTDFYIKEEHGK